MTSWISSSLPKRKVVPILSYFQMNQGTFVKKTKEPTIVVAFYDIPSKMSLEKRREKFQQFLQQSSNPLVLFTQHEFADDLALCRMGLESKTRVVVLEKNEWAANTKYIPALWTQQVKQDPEIRLGRSAEEFQFGYEKKEFVIKAIDMNPFQSDDFVWVDPFSLSTENQIDSSFPIASKIPTDRIVVANPEPITADDVASSYFRGKNRITNSILAGSRRAWQEYSKQYDVVMTQKLNLSGFVGDDLFLLQYVILYRPNQFTLVPEPSLEIYLSSPKE